MVKGEEAAGQILDYLATKPEKEDTLEGIANWWIKSDKGRRSVDELQGSLNLMVARGEIERVRIKRDIFVYRVKKRLNVNG